MATADFALLLLSLVALAALIGTGALGRFVRGWGDERRIRRERLRQEELKTAILEEQLRNEVLRDLARPKPPPVPEARRAEPGQGGARPAEPGKGEDAHRER